MKERKLFQKRDILLIAVLLALALVYWGVYTYINRGTGKVSCQLLYDGKTLQTIELSEDRIFAMEQDLHIRFEVKNNAIAFIESDCPDKICIQTGFISHQGQMAACLPNRISIRIISADGHNDIDMIAN